MLYKFIIDLYTGHEQDSLEEFRKRTEEVINRFHLRPRSVPREAMYIVIECTEDNSFRAGFVWNMLRPDTPTRGKRLLEQRKKEFTELKMDFNIDFIGEI